MDTRAFKEPRVTRLWENKNKNKLKQSYVPNSCRSGTNAFLAEFDLSGVSLSLSLSFSARSRVIYSLEPEGSLRWIFFFFKLAFFYNKEKSDENFIDPKSLLFFGSETTILDQNFKKFFYCSRSWLEFYLSDGWVTSVRGELLKFLEQKTGLGRVCEKRLFSLSTFLMTVKAADSWYRNKNSFFSFHVFSEEYFVEMIFYLGQKTV